MLVTKAVAGQPPVKLSNEDWTGIKEAHAKWRNAFYRNGVDWTAANTSQQWLTRFDDSGFSTMPNGQSWSWGLALLSYGFTGQELAMTSGAELRVEQERLVRDWDAVLREWHVNDARGLEHGFVVNQSPPSNPKSDKLLHFLMAVRGSLKPQVSASGLDVAFADEEKVVRVRYSGLKVWDADHRMLRAFFTSEGETSLRLTVDTRGARYPLTVDPIAQQTRLKAGNAGAGDRFGHSVAVHGNRVVVGAPREDGGASGVNGPLNNDATNSGAAYVFVRTGGVWVQEAYLKAFSHSASGDEFGTSVAISDGWVVVGAPFRNLAGGTFYTENYGAAFTYRLWENGWARHVMLRPSHLQGIPNFGASVAIEGGLVVVGAPAESSSSTGVNSVPNQASTQAGAAYVFSISTASYDVVQLAYLKASNTGAGDRFGSAVSISGVTVAVGAPREDSGTAGVNPASNEESTDSGAAYVFVMNGNTWSQQAWFKASNPGAGDEFGSSVSVSRDALVVGAPKEDSGSAGINSTPNENAANAGAAYVFTRSSATWSQQAYLKASHPGAGDEFGRAVAVFSLASWSNKVVVGAPMEDGSGTGINPPVNENAPDSGAVYVFEQGTFGGWSQLATLKPSSVAAGDAFGSAVGIDGDYVIVGVPLEDSGPDESVLLNAGAACVFNLNEPYSFPKLRVQGITPQNQFFNINNGARVTIPNTSIGKTSEIIVNLQNLGAPDLLLTGDPAIQISGASADEFEIVPPPKTLLSSPENGTDPSSTRFTVRFVPHTVGPKEVTVTIPNNTPDTHPFVIPFGSYALVANPTPLQVTGLTQIYDGTPRPVGIEGGDGRPVTIQYQIDSVFGSQPPVNAGEYLVRRSLDTGPFHYHTLAILKAALLAAPDPQHKLVGQPNPPLTITYSGFMQGEDQDSAIDEAPHVITTAGLNSLGGNYKITSFGGHAANYEFIHQPGVLTVETFAASYQALLIDAETGRPAGLLDIKVAPNNQTFTGKLFLPETRKAISLKGNLKTDPATETSTGTSILANDSGLLTILLTLNEGFSASLTRQGQVVASTGQGKKRLVLARKEKIPHSGRHTVLLMPVSPLPDTPAGQGWAMAIINTKGTLRLAGRLPDGTAFTSSLSADDEKNPGYRLFLRPWKPVRLPAYVAGVFSLLPHPSIQNRCWVPLSSPANIHWRKTGHIKDASYRSGFEELELTFVLAPWQPPVKAGKSSPAILLRERLGLDPGGGIILHYETLESPDLPDLPSSVFLTPPKNTLRQPDGVANTASWRLSVNPANGALNGWFEMMFEGRKSKVLLRGVMLQTSSDDASPVIGGGHFLFPHLSLNEGRETRSGSLHLERAVP